MNKQRLNGALDEVVGSAKRKAGEWTDNTLLQVEGIAQQAKGKIESAFGKIKDQANEGIAKAEAQQKARP